MHEPLIISLTSHWHFLPRFTAASQAKANIKALLILIRELRVIRILRRWRFAHHLHTVLLGKLTKIGLNPYQGVSIAGGFGRIGVKAKLNVNVLLSALR